MSEKQACSIAGWGNRWAITGWGPWGVTPPLQTFQWIIGDPVQCFRTPPCPARTQGGCSPLHPQRMRNVTGDQEWFANGILKTLKSGNSLQIQENWQPKLGWRVTAQTSDQCHCTSDTTRRDQHGCWSPLAFVYTWVVFLKKQTTLAGLNNNH